MTKNDDNDTNDLNDANKRHQGRIVNRFSFGIINLQMLVVNCYVVKVILLASLRSLVSLSSFLVIGVVLYLETLALGALCNCLFNRFCC